MTIRWKVRGGHVGVTFGRDFVRPDCEACGPWGCGFWYAQAFGVSVWRDTLPAVTVGERGAW